MCQLRDIRNFTQVFFPEHSYILFAFKTVPLCKNVFSRGWIFFHVLISSVMPTDLPWSMSTIVWKDDCRSNDFFAAKIEAVIGNDLVLFTSFQQLSNNFLSLPFDDSIQLFGRITTFSTFAVHCGHWKC